jgi:predicted PurR-regulated permease PerM
MYSELCHLYLQVLWRIAFAPVTSGTAKFYLFAQATEADIQTPSNNALSKINSAIVAQIVVFSITLGIIGVLVFILAGMVADALLDPVQQLQAFLNKVQNDELDANVPTIEEAASRDAADLYESFSGLLTSLRFGSDLYTAGNLGKARQVFSDALTMFQLIENVRGQV